MDDHTEAERAKFEAWNKEHGEYRRSDAFDRDADKPAEYDNWAVQRVWLAWQAARATLASTPAALTHAVGARVEADCVIVKAKGGNDSARALCGELVALIESAHLRAPATREKPSPVEAHAILIEAARAVVARWNTPAWKEVEHTAAFIARLDDAIQAARAAPPAQQWPQGLLDRVKAATRRISDGHAPRRIPADPTDVDLVLGEVQALIEGRDPPFWVPPAQQWVSVAERLPENEQGVLILFNPYGNPANKARVLEAVHTDGGFYDWDDGLELHHPTHWMPKPALQGAAPQHQGGGK